MRKNDPIQLLTPDWPSPANVRAVISTRVGGCSQGAFAGANLGDHVGDDPVAVSANRTLLERQTGVQGWPWLKQVHGTEVVALNTATPCGQIADGAFSQTVGIACAVLTADCLPVLLCNTQGTQVAAVHAGWRGLAAGILQQAVKPFSATENLLAYLGPAIGPQHFEVGVDVHQAYAGLFSRLGFAGDWQSCFQPSPNKPRHFYADLYGLARLVLRCLGIHQVYGGQYCTFADSERFFSYRRDGVTGRTLSAIWLAADTD